MSEYSSPLLVFHDSLKSYKIMLISVENTDLRKPEKPRQELTVVTENTDESFFLDRNWKNALFSALAGSIRRCAKCYAWIITKSCYKINAFLYIFFRKNDFFTFWKNRFFIHNNEVFCGRCFPDFEKLTCGAPQGNIAI